MNACIYMCAGDLGSAMAQEFAPPQPQIVTFNVMSGSYVTFISDLRRALAGKSPDKVKERPVLDKQTGEDAAPPRWIHVELKEGNVSPKVAIRSDNAYLVGFTNKDGKWFQLSPRGSKKIVDANAEMLGFNGHYMTLVGGVSKLTGLDLARGSTWEAAQALWYHKQGNADAGNVDGDVNSVSVAGDPQGTLKKKLATLAVVLCEAARLEPVCSVINSGWQKKSSSITDKEVRYIKDWGDLSTALLGWKADKYKNDDKHFGKFSDIGIHNGGDALAVVQLLLNKPPKKGFLAWLKHLWGLLVEKKKEPQQQEEKIYQKPELEKNQKPKSSAIVNPL